MKKNETHVKPDEVVQQMKEDRCEFFVNSKLEPTVHVPDDDFQKDWSADDQRVLDLTVLLFSEKSGGRPPRSGEKEFLLSHIREECRKGGRRLSEAEAEETEQDVIVQAMVCFMNDRGEYADRTAVLLVKLQNLQTRSSVSQHEVLPVFVHIFSRRLRRLIPVLRGYGLEVSIEHKEDGSHCRVTKLASFEFEPDPKEVQPKTADDSDVKSSGRSSVAGAKRGTNLQTADGSDGEIRYDNADAKSERAAEPEAPATGEVESTDTTEGGDR